MPDHSEKETEVKFQVENPEEIKSKLEELAEPVYEDNFQRTRHLDNSSHDLVENQIYLRTREEDKGDIATVKTGSSEDLDYFQRDEIEVGVDDAEKMASLLKALGFDLERVLEKKRSLFTKGELEFCLDITPIGNFLEIEGPPEKIEEMIEELGLEGKERIDTHYWEINRRHCEEKGIPETQHIVFEDSPVEQEELEQ